MKTMLSSTEETEETEEEGKAFLQELIKELYIGAENVCAHWNQKK